MQAIMTLKFVLLLFLILIDRCICYHILVSSTCQSYGHWNTLLHISKELLSRNHSITYSIEQNHHYYLNTITKDNQFNSSMYQIIYTSNEPIFTDEREKLYKSNRKNSINLETILFFYDYIIEPSLVSFEKIITFLDLMMNGVINNTCMNSNTIDMKTIKFIRKIDVCLLDSFHIFAIYLCDIFNIPTILPRFNAGLQTQEYYNLKNSYIYFNDIFVFNGYPNNLINGTIMSYSERWKNVIKKIGYILIQKMVSHFKIKPILNGLNSKYNLSVNINSYNDGLHSFYNKAVLISSFGSPFSNVFYSRPRIKQYGFLIFPTPKILESDNLLLSKWINFDNKPILYICMGSTHLLEGNLLQHIYQHLLQHITQNKYRILWALRQNIYDNVTNDELQRSEFKIMEWIPQLKVLQHPNVKLFLTHAGSNSILEGLYTKTLMISFPIFGDQFFNAKRIEELECGITIKDRKRCDDLTDSIDKLLLNENIASYYQNNINLLHQILDKNGGVSDAVDFIENASQFGIKHLFCTLGHIYDCDQMSIPWYQKTMIDVYIIAMLIMIGFYIFVKQIYRTCCDKTNVKI